MLKFDVKQNANSGNLDKMLHFLALICARIFVFESTFCKTIILNLTVSMIHMRLQIVPMLLVGLSIMLIFLSAFVLDGFIVHG